MTMIKGFTDIKQSKKLAEILPLESADMYYSHEFVNSAGDYYRLNIASEGYFDDEESLGSDIPCWSLAALLCVLPRLIEIDGSWTFLSSYPSKHLGSVIEYSNNKEDFVGLAFCSKNLIDACYEMILKLHELNLL